MSALSKETAHQIAYAYAEIEAAQTMLADVKAAIDRSGPVDIRDGFGRRQAGLQLGVPHGDNGHRIFNVPYALAVPVIEATIAQYEAKLSALQIKAQAELSNANAGEPA